MIKDQGKHVDWVNTMYKQLHKELMRWIASETRWSRV